MALSLHHLSPTLLFLSLARSLCSLLPLSAPCRSLSTQLTSLVPTLIATPSLFVYNKLSVAPPTTQTLVYEPVSVYTLEPLKPLDLSALSPSDGGFFGSHAGHVLTLAELVGVLANGWLGPIEV